MPLARPRAPEPAPTPIPASQERPNTRECFRLALASMDLTALGAAGEFYGDDVDREMADLLAGRHPLQQGGHGLDAVARIDADLARIRENHPA